MADIQHYAFLDRLAQHGAIPNTEESILTTTAFPACLQTPARGTISRINIQAPPEPGFGAKALWLERRPAPANPGKTRVAQK
jgi:hypothetical protein